VLAEKYNSAPSATSAPDNQVGNISKPTLANVVLFNEAKTCVQAEEARVSGRVVVDSKAFAL
jgi:hypothetical protein